MDCGEEIFPLSFEFTDLFLLSLLSFLIEEVILFSNEKEDDALGFILEELEDCLSFFLLSYF